MYRTPCGWTSVVIFNNIQYKRTVTQCRRTDYCSVSFTWGNALFSCKLRYEEHNGTSGVFILLMLYRLLVACHITYVKTALRMHISLSFKYSFKINASACHMKNIYECDRYYLYRIFKFKFKFKKRFIETHIHIQQRYIRSLYNSKHSLEIAPAGTYRDNSATFTSKRRCDVVPKQNDAAIMPRVRREWHVIYKDISNSTWITCVSMRVIRSPEAYTALNYDVWSNPDSNVCRASVVPTSVQHRCPRIVFSTGYAT